MITDLADGGDQEVRPALMAAGDLQLCNVWISFIWELPPIVFHYELYRELLIPSDAAKAMERRELREAGAGTIIKIGIAFRGKNAVVKRKE